MELQSSPLNIFLIPPSARGDFLLEVACHLTQPLASQRLIVYTMTVHFSLFTFIFSLFKVLLSNIVANEREFKVDRKCVVFIGA